MELANLIRQGESSKLDFKQSFDRETIETVCAFANAEGGKIIVGVSNKGHIKGLSVSDETMQSYINQIKTQTEPSLIVDIDAKKIDRKSILLIKVGEFPIKPVSCKGRYYQCKSNSNHQLNLTEIANLHIQSLQLSWDSYPATDAGWHDLDSQKIQKFIQRVNQKGRFELSGSIEENLVKLNLLKEGQITQAAKLLFAKE